MYLWERTLQPFIRYTLNSVEQHVAPALHFLPYRKFTVLNNTVILNENSFETMHTKSIELTPSCFSSSF